MAQGSAALRADSPINCFDCAEWNQPLNPFRLFGNSYYVGAAGVSALLITSDAGHILLDGALPQSAALIDASIRKLGFRTEDIRVIVNSHEHYDHAGGIAALQRASGATVAASATGATALQQGFPTPEDPQFESGRGKFSYRPISGVRVVADGEVVRVGELALTAHLTPGHTPGSTTWTWRSCEGTRCLNLVYADSLSAISDDGFRFSGDGKRASVVDSFRRSIDKVAGLPCDIIVSTHPVSTNLADKLARWKKAPDSNPFIDANGCRAYAETARARLEARIKEEGG